MGKSVEERRALAMDRFDTRYVQLEAWTTRLIRAAKKVESLRRECKALRSQVSGLTGLINAGAELRKEARRAEKAANAAAKLSELAPSVTVQEDSDPTF